MDFNTFLSKITATNFSNINFDGKEAQLRMVPKSRQLFDVSKIKNAKEAGVLAVFYPNAVNETCFLLTLRAAYNGTHASQISFPGGKKDALDNSLKETALRETLEEVGLSISKTQVLMSLAKTYIPPSNFLVSPFIAVIEQQPLFTKNYEVATLIEVKLSDLLNDDNAVTKEMTTSYMKNVTVPCFELNGYTVWGATAMILSEIKVLLS